MSRKSELERALRDFRRHVLENDRHMLADISRAYHQTWRKIRRAIEELNREYERLGGDVSQVWFYQSRRYRELEALIAEELGKLGSRATRITTGAIDKSVDDGLHYSAELVALQAGDLGKVGYAYLDRDAVLAMLGYSRPGAPLEALMRSISEEGAKSALDTLVQGLLLGYNPVKVAPTLRDTLGTTLTRAMTIARTESIRALREAQMESYRANPNIVREWQWQASMDKSTCLVCMAMHGKRFPISESMSSHPNCRCVSVPVLRSWAELGEMIGVDATGIDEMGPTLEEQAKRYGWSDERLAQLKARRMSGADFFSGLSPEKQIDIMGKSRWIAWKDGIISLDGTVKETWSPVWGNGRGLAPLSDVLDNETIKQFQGLGSEYYRIITSKVEASASSYEIARQLLDRYTDAEPELTAMIQGIVEGQGGTMAGLEFRLKSVDSLARKITSDAVDKGLSEFDAATGIKDVSRYTAIFDRDSLISRAKEIENEMIDAGYNLISRKNSFGGDGMYHGLHYNFSRDGISFELQFHTQQSFDIKMANHYDYEVNRSANISEALRKLTEKWMTNKWADFLPPALFELIVNYP